MTRIFNLETLKIELHFEKSEYQAMSDAQKSELKSAYLWSNYGKCWVSRAKEPNLYSARKTAEKLGFAEEQRSGERISYAEQMERQRERAEARADRAEARADAAEARAEQLQKPINDMRGDIAFFTQPNISSSSGRAFTARREKMFAAYDRGFEELKKSEHYRDRAETARATAKAEQLKDRAFVDRRIKEAQKDIRAREKNIIHYEEMLYKLEQGESLKRFDGTPLTEETVREWLEREIELTEALMDKEGFYQDCLNSLGGVQYSRDNIKAGYTVKLARWGLCEVLSAGPKNISYKILTGGAAGLGGTAAYAEITEIVKAEEKAKEAHPFSVGQSFTVPRWDGHSYKDASYTVVKSTASTVTLRTGEEQPIIRKPQKRHTSSGDLWAIRITDSHNGIVYRA